MGLFNSIIKNKKPIKKENDFHWIPLTSIDELQNIKEYSNKEFVLIFKHSTRCGISRIVLKSFENSFYDSLKNNKVYYLDLLNYRSISNEISTVFNVTHESPQLLIIKNEVALTYASHYDITTLDIDSYK